SAAFQRGPARPVAKGAGCGHAATKRTLGKCKYRVAKRGSPCQNVPHSYRSIGGDEVIMQTSAAGHCVFPTALGHVGLAFSAAGLTRLVLPQRDPKAVASRLVGADRQQVGPALPDTPAVSLPMRKVPGWVDQLLEAVCAYAAG